MQKEVCFDGQGQSEPIKNHKFIKTQKIHKFQKLAKIK